MAGYHAAINVDLNTGEFFVICVRPPCSREAADRLLGLDWEKALDAITDSDFSASAKSLRYRTGVQSRPLAALLRDAVNSLSGARELQDKIAAEAGRLTLMESKRHVRAALRDNAFAISTLPSSDRRHHSI